jgi:hypothetical protein
MMAASTIFVFAMFVPCLTDLLYTLVSRLITKERCDARCFAVRIAI